MNVGSILNDDAGSVSSNLDRPKVLGKMPPRSHASAAPPSRDPDPASGIASLLNAAAVSSDPSETALSHPATLVGEKNPPRHRQLLENILNVTKSPSKDSTSELDKLHLIRNPTKPRRYESPPIWAQTWIPPSMRGNMKLANPANGGARESALSNKPVFDYSHTASVDLECSITGIIPTPSITKTIAEWIYANFRDIAEHNRKYVELELKFGTIIDKARGSRINLNVLTECIYNDHALVHFDMLVAEKAWDDIHRLFADLETLYQEDLKKAGPRHGKPPRKFNTMDEDMTDSFYHAGRPGEHPKSVRVSTDKTLNPPRHTAIEKQRLLDLYIHNPSSMYDMRLSLSLEMPVEESIVAPLISKGQPHLIREKKRNTWTHLPTITRFDLTRVLIPRELKNKDGKRVVTHDKNYEIELEVDTLEMFNAVDKIVQGLDLYRFEELVEIFINNGRVINNRVTKLAQP